MAKALINLKINNIPISVEEGTTILDAAKKIKY
jgi:NADH dehydrogenase/NADH:ubiquinone oxidoreductase subunit G